MKRVVHVHIGGLNILGKLDFFDDEEIVVDSSIKKVQDIDKVFTDVSITWTVPGSENNNRIFSHFYNSDVDGGFQANTRVDARIEIDLVVFRIGKLQLESAVVKDNQNTKLQGYILRRNSKPKRSIRR